MMRWIGPDGARENGPYSDFVTAECDRSPSAERGKRPIDGSLLPNQLVVVAELAHGVRVTLGWGGQNLPNQTGSVDPGLDTPFETGSGSHARDPMRGRAPSGSVTARAVGDGARRSGHVAREGRVQRRHHPVGTARPRSAIRPRRFQARRRAPPEQEIPKNPQ